ncbi:MAG TPA: carboxypeptidase regulatory-like domain-containing protein [Bryobacteraceae bacterium]|nr:carboxypeptidase regulatory-like domain-containing protein [Bryobacteraceae bacterium]
MTFHLPRDFRFVQGVFCILAAGLTGASICSAQDSRAEVTGRVTDQSQAVISGAEVTLINTATRIERRTQTNSSGQYSVPFLPAGGYEVTVQYQGFRPLRQSGVVLEVGEVTRLDFALQLGALTETVKVDSTAPPVATATAAVGTNVDSQRIDRLPLNGRNALQLVALTPGVVSIGKTGQMGMMQESFRIAGGRPIDTNFKLDGGNNMNTYFATAVEYPNPDALQEFTVSQRSVSAVAGRGTVTVSAVTKSGTNEFHGTAFEFLRNTELDSRSFFASNRPVFKRNQFGATLGGPIRKDHTFFFFSYQGTVQRGSPRETRYRTLTQAERDGDFSTAAGQVNDPKTGIPYPNKRVPASQITDFARKNNAYLPLPNQAAGFYSFGVKQKLDQNQLIGKVDHNFTDKDKVSFRYMFNNVPQVDASPGPVSEDWLVDLPTRTQSWNLSYTRIISPSIVNNVVLTHIRNAFGVKITSNDWSPKGLGLNINQDNAILEYGLTSGARTAVNGYFTMYNGYPTRLIMPTTHLLNSTSIVKGSHSLQTGVELYRNRENYFQNWFTGGNLTFRGTASGNAAADYLLGRYDSYRQLTPIINRMRQNLWALFIQDDWRVHRRLMLNIGLRWDPFGAWNQEDKSLSTFRPGVQSTLFPNAPSGLLYPGDNGLPQSIVGNRYDNFGPRAGLAWDVFGNGRTSVRAGAGIFYVPIIRGISFDRFPLIQPFTLDLNLVNGGDVYNIFAAPPFNGKNPYPIPDRTDLAGLRNFQFVPTAGHTGFALPFKTQSENQWNVSIQQAIGADAVLDIAYLGSTGSHEFTSAEVNPARYIPGVDAAGRALSSTGNTQQRRLYPQFGSINESRSSVSTNYNALQISFNRRYARGFTVLTSYTLGKSLGVVAPFGEGANGPRNPFNYSIDYGPIDQDVKHNFVLSYVWNVPSLAHGSRFLGGVVNGWQINGITTIRSGFPYRLSSGLDNSLTGINGDTPDQVSDWRLPDNRSKAEMISAFFKGSAFARNAVGTFGNVGVNAMRGPGLWNYDMGVAKAFKITEAKRVEFRASFFNLFNHANFSNPSSSLTSPTFGQLTGTTGDPRIIEFGLKLYF